MSARNTQRPGNARTCDAPAFDAEAKGGKTIHIHHLTRVEGHGNVVIEIDEEDRILACRWEVPEAPRFFEAMLQGRNWSDAHQIVSRICGICSIGHQLASIQATEDAMNIHVSAQTIALRKLALHAENLQSHLLHLAYLVLPDLMGVDSVIPLAETHRTELTGLIALRRLSNEFSRIICGRTTHPQRMIPGGFTRVPEEDDLRSLLCQFEGAMPGMKRAVELFRALAPKFPAFERPTEYIALVAPDEYALYLGEVGSTHDSRKPASFYKDMTREYCVPQSTAKWTRNARESFMVGALARFNINYGHLHPLAREAARQLGLSAPSANPFHNNLAQLVECINSVEDALILIEGLLTDGVRRERTPVIRPQAGRGVGAVEVPRGILFHCYEYDAKGRMVQADCVIPTNMNHANIQHDLEALVDTIRTEPKESIELKVSMLVRAYDPCISCSTHVIDLSPGERGCVRWVRRAP